MAEQVTEILWFPRVFETFQSDNKDPVVLS
jgi:hypothetical protein